MAIQFKSGGLAPKYGTPTKPSSNHILKAVSEFRRSQLEQETAGYDRESKTSQASYVLPSISKKASATTSDQGGGSGWRGSGGTVRQNIEPYSPLWLVSNLNFPRDRATINSWLRAYFVTNGLIQNAISLHSTYPISKLSIKCKDPAVERHFSEMIEETDLMNVCVGLAQEYWLLGEAFPYAELDERTGKWSRIIIQNPDYITVRQSIVGGDPIISLRPDEQLKKICTGGSPEDIRQRRELNPAIVAYVRKGEPIPLDNLAISHIARKIAPYEIRGTGLPVSCFKQLMLFDKIREAIYTQTSNMINPLTLVKIGGPDYKPMPADLELWREAFMQQEYDPDFKIFTHDAVTVERIGYNNGILDTSNLTTQLIKEIYTGLMVPSVLMDGGSDTTYANGGVALDVLRQRYMQFRNMLSVWLRRKIFAPISKMMEFTEIVDKEERLIIPEVDWNHMSLFDMGDYIQHLKDLSAGEVPKASMQTLYRSLGLDYEDERRKIRSEAIDQAILAKERAALETMPLSECRALGPNDEIQESIEAPLPGQDVPGEESNLGMPPSPGSGLGSPEPPSAPPPPPPPPSPSPPK